jgi:cyclic-di-GMP-binding protein
MKQGRSGLTFRESQPQHQPVFELSPRKVKQWASELAVANIGESSKSTYRLIVDVNLAGLSAEKHLAILYAIEPVADELTHSLEKQFLNNHIALTEKQKKIAALVQAIQTELVLGFQKVVDTLSDGEPKLLQRSSLGSAISSAITYHGYIILRCYQLYTSVPEKIWGELYTLYKIACFQEIEAKHFSHGKQKDKVSARQHFIKILLLSISNPYQLRQQEILLLWQLLPELDEEVTLKSHAYNNNHFLIDLDSKQPPIHKSFYKSEKKTKALKLTAYPAVEMLNKILLAATEKNQLSARRSMLLKHVIECWQHDCQRTFARTGCNELLEIAIGLGASHYLLMQSPSETSPDLSGAKDTLEAMEGSLKNATLFDEVRAKEKPNYHNKNYLSSSGPPDDDVWAKLYRPEEAIKQAINDIETKNRSRDTIAKDSYKLQQVSLVNMSPGGYCIEIIADNLPKHAQTGEVLGLLEADQQNREHWSIGVVRWVKRQAKTNIIQMGVELLAPAATPINMQLRNSKSQVNEFQRSLLLPALTGIGQPETILTNPLTFSVNSKVKIVEHGQEFAARLAKEVAVSSSFKQFEFERLSDGQETPQRSKPRPETPYNPKNFDGVWDII